MTTDDEKNLSKKEAVENELYYFGKALHVLSLEPTEQCEVMGNVNVAWELKSDVSRGISMAESGCLSLSATQEAAVRQLIELLNRIPQSVLVEATTSEANLRAMQHKSWNSPRKHSKIVLRAFGLEESIN